MTVAALAGRVRNAAVVRVLSAESGQVTPQLVYRLCEQARERMRGDVAAAADCAEAALAAARCASDRRALAEALRMKGHVCYLGGRYRQAAAAYRRAIALLDRLGLDVDAGRTLSSALQSLIYLGRYDEAMQWAVRARRIFEREGDQLRLARLDSNAGNVLHRQDRYEEALALYNRAVKGLLECGDAESAAIALRNLAVCHAALHDFDKALDAYREAERIYRGKGLKLLAAEVDDNIAHLYYIRGDYFRALSLYRASDVEGRGNTYQAAVVMLDQSDLLLELNLFGEAAALAAEAADRFASLGVRYERGKALVNLAIATYRGAEPDRAPPILARARGLFQREKNAVWQAAADQYRAVSLLESGRVEAARAAAIAALEVIENTPLAGQALLALLLLARIELGEDRPAPARGYYQRALAKAALVNTLPARLRLHMAAGTLFEAEGDPGAAWAEYESARLIVEMIQVQLPSDGLRIAFLSDKHAVYERLVHLAVTSQVSAPMELAHRHADRAKSRSLAESMVQGTQAYRLGGEPGEVEAVRRELSWHYRRLDRIESAKESPSPRAIEALRDRIAECERRLADGFAFRYIRPVPDTEGLDHSLAQVQSALPDGGSLLDYFTAKGTLYLFVITRSRIHAVTLGGIGEIERTARLLRFQLSRSAFGGPAPAPGDKAWQSATQSHLRRLYRLLIEPAEPWLGDGHWVVVPHGLLHRVPFHALDDGAAWVIDRRTLSYAPSSTVYRLCQEPRASCCGEPVVFGVPDDRAPYLLDEARAVAALLPGARLFAGGDASRLRLEEAAPASRLIHLATHGILRQDNPLFSSVRLADSRLCLYDLYDLKLAAELVTLSGCATGAHETRGVDEIIGLARGLLAAGARTVHLSLWEVNDRSTAAYMVRFYTGIRAGCSIAEASRRAMIETRQRYPHPYFWAPFTVTGRPDGYIFSKGGQPCTQ